MAKQRNKIKNDVIKQIRLLLGDGMVDIELDPEHYDLAIDIALDKIRQRSENAVEEDFYTIQLKKDQDEYTLPAEIIEVKKVHHRSFGHGISAGVDMDPFELAYANYIATGNTEFLDFYLTVLTQACYFEFFEWRIF